MADLGATAYLLEDEFFIAKRASGVVLDDQGNPAKRMVMSVSKSNAITGISGSIETGFSNSNTGEFSIGCGFENSVTVLAFDDDAGISYNALVFDKVLPS